MELSRNPYRAGWGLGLLLALAVLVTVAVSLWLLRQGSVQPEAATPPWPAPAEQPASTAPGEAAKASLATTADRIAQVPEEPPVTLADVLGRRGSKGAFEFMLQILQQMAELIRTRPVVPDTLRFQRLDDLFGDHEATWRRRFSLAGPDQDNPGSLIARTGGMRSGYQDELQLTLPFAEDDPLGQEFFFHCYRWGKDSNPPNLGIGWSVKADRVTDQALYDSSKNLVLVQRGGHETVVQVGSDQAQHLKVGVQEVFDALQERVDRIVGKMPLR